MIETIHRQAILKLINYFTRTPSNHDAQATTNSNSSSGEAQLYRFKEPCDFINLPSITRLGAVISKFDQFFRPSGHLLEAAHSLKSPYNSVNILYLQQITELVQFIELNLFDSIPNIRNERINVDTSQALQSSEHLHALILIIKDWIQQFYIDDTNILPSIFPVLNEERTIFKLVDITENNICVWAILIFNVIYKLRDCFPEYTHVLDFSWSFLFYATMENLADVVRFDSNFISSLLQTSLLYARMEEEQERQTYAAQYKQIETLQAKIVETKKRSQALLMSHAGGGVGGKGGAGKGLGNSAALISSATNITQIAVPQMGTAAAMRTITGGGGAGGTKNSRAKAGGKRGAAGGGFHSTVAGSSASTATTNTTSNALLNEKPYHCHSCNKTFPTSYKLNRHAYSHSGERPYQCTWPNCEKRFNDNYHLRRHTNTHTGDKPFPCKYPGCSKRYSRSEDLRNHQKTHYPNSGGGGGGGGVGGAIMTHNHQTNTATNHNNVPIDEHKFNLIAVQQHQQQQQQQQQQSQSNNPSSQQLSSIAVPTQQYASLPVVTTSMVVAAHPHQAPLPMSSKAAAQAAVAAAAVSATAVTPDQVLVLNQLHMQLQQQHQQQVQQQQQQQQQSNNTFSSMSPVLSDETTTSLLLAQEQQQQQQQQSTAASAAQNHVQAGLHSIADYNF